jgi:multiple sugar transport system substrate-binding protein
MRIPTRRKPMNKHMLLIGLAVLLVASLVACGAPSTPTKESIVESTPEGVPESEEKIELRLWQYQSPGFLNANKELARRFEAEHPNVTIKIDTFDYGDYQSALQTSMAAGTEGDVLEVFGSWACNYADRLDEMPTSVMSYSEAQDMFYAATLEGYYCDGKLYGLPQEFNIGNGAVLVNPKMFEEAGLEYPPNWETTEDLLEDAQAVTKWDGDMMTVAGFHFIEGDGIAFQFLAGILQRGGDFWKPDNSGLQLDTPEARETLLEMKSWVDDYAVVDPFLFNEDSNSIGTSFFNGQVAIGFIGPWIVPFGREEYPDAEFDYVPLPNYAGDKHYFVADSGWGKTVSRNSEHKELAWEFVRFSTTVPENARIWNIHTATVPALESLKDDQVLLEELDFIKPSLDIVEYGRYVGPLPDRDQFWYEIVYKHILAVLQDVETVDEALEAMDVEANELFR